MPGFKQVFVQGLTEVSASLKDELGARRLEGGKVYRYVKLRTGATVAGVAGDPVVYAVAASSEEDGTATVSTRRADGAATPVFAGLLMASVAGVASTDYYVWIQTKGPAFSNPAIAGTIGQAFQFGASDKSWAAIAAFTDCAVGVVANVASKRIILFGNTD